MRMIAGFGSGGLLLGALVGVIAHFTSYTGRSGVYIEPSANDLFQRPPWNELFGWAGLGLVVGLVIGGVLLALGFRLVRLERR